ncbi:hypothetical protein GBAR_LOCUS89 [Geodia barretti]|uniref:Uncharacterized protein n=1 Tax=Geodia barretti TaxID=519541 RepID=A0AA35QRA9_GEOBA|nr:hypothetical protein GBAR_LOCUS89 [Geodia barretti]
MARSGIETRLGHRPPRSGGWICVGHKQRSGL